MGLLAHKASAGKTWPAIMVGMFVAFGGILYGYVFAYISLVHLFYPSYTSYLLSLCLNLLFPSLSSPFFG